MKSPNGFLGCRELHKLLDGLFSEHTIRTYMSAGKWPVEKIGGHLYIRAEHAQQILEQRGWMV